MPKCTHCSGTGVSKHSDLFISVDLDTNVISIGGVDIILWKQQAEIANLLWKAMPSGVRHGLLIETLWPRDEPEDPEGTIKVIICKLRHKLAGHPVRVDAVYSVGYRMLRTDLQPTKVTGAIQSLQEVGHAG